LRDLRSLCIIRAYPGAKLTLRGRLTQYESIPRDRANVTGHVNFPDNATVVLPMAAQGDGVYQPAFVAPLTGVYTVRIADEGKSLRGALFTSEADANGRNPR